MKQILILVSLFLSVVSYSQSSDTLTEINVETQATKIGATNLVNDSTIDQAAALNSILQKCGKKKVKLEPGHVYLYRSQLTIYSNLYLTGGGTLKTDANFTGGDLDGIIAPVGVSNVTIDGVGFTNYWTKKQNSVLRFNSAPGANDNIKIINNWFADIWATTVIMFGQTGPNETHYTTNVLIDHNTARNIYNPAQPIVYNTTDDKCDFVNYEQTTRTATFSNNICENISGRVVYGSGYGNGFTQPLVVPANACNWDFLNNHIKRVWCAFETNGDHLGYNSTVDNNTITDITWDGGWSMSLNGINLQVTNNKVIVCGRGFLEYTGINSQVANNKWNCKNWWTGSELTAPSVKMTRVDGINGYGFNNGIDHNEFIIDTFGNRFTTLPNEINTIALIGKNDEPAGIQPESESYQGISDYSSFWNIHHNNCVGFDKHGIYPNVNMINYVTVKDNTFRSWRCTGDIVQNYGKYWNVENNLFNTTGSPAPNAFTGYFNVFKKQNENYFPTQSVLGKNDFIGPFTKYVNVSWFVPKTAGATTR